MFIVLISLSLSLSLSFVFFSSFLCSAVQPARHTRVRRFCRWLQFVTSFNGRGLDMIDSSSIIGMGFFVNSVIIYQQDSSILVFNILVSSFGWLFYCSTFEHVLHAYHRRLWQSPRPPTTALWYHDFSKVTFRFCVYRQRAAETYVFLKKEKNVFVHTHFFFFTFFTSSKLFFITFFITS